MDFNSRLPGGKDCGLVGGYDCCYAGSSSGSQHLFHLTHLLVIDNDVQREVAPEAVFPAECNYAGQLGTGEVMR